MHAVGRIAYRGAIDNIQVSWVKMGAEGVRQILRAGVNDLGGTLMDENISRAAGASHGQLMDAERFAAIVEPLGRGPGPAHHPLRSGRRPPHRSARRRQLMAASPRPGGGPPPPPAPDVSGAVDRLVDGLDRQRRLGRPTASVPVDGRARWPDWPATGPR